MNRTIGATASAVLTASIVMFAVTIITGQAAVSYAASLFLSWAYLLLAAAIAAEANAERKSAAFGGFAFAILYAAFATAVYFVQLTTVAHGTASPDLLKSLSYQELGSLMFNVDLLGYGLMAVSTFFIGFSLVIRTRADAALRLLLVAHGAFAPVTMLLPILDVFGRMSQHEGATTGIVVLLAWCLYFTPVGVLATYHFGTLRTWRRDCLSQQPEG